MAFLYILKYMEHIQSFTPRRRAPQEVVAVLERHAQFCAHIHNTGPDAQRKLAFSLKLLALVVDSLNLAESTEVCRIWNQKVEEARKSGARVITTEARLRELGW